jgi:hypothetical protein
MPTLLDDIHTLATQIAATDDEHIRDSADILCRDYRRRRLVALGMAAVDSMVHDGPEATAEDDPRLVAVREWFRDSLQELLRWARETGKLD